MSSDQAFLGLLGFDDAASAEQAIAESADAARAEPTLVARLAREDAVVSVATKGSMPSTLWFPMTAMLYELGGRATRGHVAMLYEGDGDELGVAAPYGVGPAAPSSLHPSRWLPLEGATSTHELVRGGAPAREMRFDVARYADGARALDVTDWLGLFMHLVPDGDRLFAVVPPLAPAASQRLGASERVHLVAELDRPGSTYLFAHPNKERMTVFRVAGRETARLATRTIEGALAIDIAVHDVPFDRADLRRATMGPTARRRLWLEEGRGLVAIRE